MTHEQLVDYLLVNNIHCNEQFGFWSGYSTELPALHLVDNMINQIIYFLNRRFIEINKTIIYT